jgi:hypothetical protein
MGQQQVAIGRNEWLACPVFIQVNNGQAGMAETDATIIHGFIAKAIRATMMLDGGHVHQQLGVHWFVGVTVENACYTTHID